MKTYEYEVRGRNLNLYTRGDEFAFSEMAGKEVRSARGILFFVSQAPHKGNLEQTLSTALDKAMPDQTARTSYRFSQIGSDETIELNWGPGPNLRRKSEAARELARE